MKNKVFNKRNITVSIGITMVFLFVLVYGSELVNRSYVNRGQRQLYKYSQVVEQPFIVMNGKALKIEGHLEESKLEGLSGIGEGIYTTVNELEIGDNKGTQIVGKRLYLGNNILDELEEGYIYVYKDDREIAYRILDIYESEEEVNPKVYEQELQSLDKNEKLLFKYVDDPSKIVTAEVMYDKDISGESGIFWGIKSYIKDKK